jgi:hypothetical protein
MRVRRSAELIQFAKAKLLSAPELRFERLSSGECRQLMRNVKTVLRLMLDGSICNAQQLHQYQCHRLAKQGWRYGNTFRPVRGETPLMTDFLALDAKAQRVVEVMYRVLRYVGLRNHFADRIAPPSNF